VALVSIVNYIIAVQVTAPNTAGRVLFENLGHATMVQVPIFFSPFQQKFQLLINMICIILRV